jgi:hypothetical protein
MSDDALDGLPPLHQRWVRDLLAGPVPAETEATCNTCAMVVDDAVATGFRADTKCCTYLPELHNFLVGGVLADTDDHPAAVAGRASVRERIARRVAVTPLGLARPRSYLMLYDEGGAAMFGRSRAMLCPHYVGGDCGVWRHRESTCSTWFCKHVRGAVGDSFWKTLHRMLAVVERQLAWWAIAELGLEPKAIQALLANRDAVRKRGIDVSELDGREPAHYRTLWGEWAGREEALYIACAERVRELAWTDALAIAGAEARALALATRSRYAALRSEALPVHLEVAAFRMVGLAGDTCRISGYSEYDPVELPAALLDVLRRFDGRARDVVIEELATDGIEIDTALLRRLVDLGILAEVSAT